jgi:N-acetylglucosaminyl-diphospho-decaprenol L-rhamnosyltransferase
LFLNADVVLREKASQRLCSVAENDRHVGVVGPRIYAADGEIELSARAFPTVATGLLGRSSALTKALTRMNRTPSGLAGALGAGGRVDWVSGACMLISRRAFDDVRGFDESYWMYWEDADLCRRMREGGWATMLATDAEARHATGSSGRSELTIEAFHNSAARYYEQHLARTALDAGLARRLLLARMRIMLYRHAQHSDN